MREQSHPSVTGKPHQRNQRREQRLPGFVLEERVGDYVLAPTRTRALALAWTVPIVNPGIMCCGQGQPGFSGPHPFPVVGGRSRKHRDAKLFQLSSWCGEVRLRLKSMVCKHTVSHCEDRLSKMGQVLTRMASSL